MSLADTVEQVRSGVVQIAFANAEGRKIGGGSGFVCNGFVVTNHHIFMGYSGAARVCLRNDEMEKDEFFPYEPGEFAGALVTGSMENSFDYAVLNLPEIVKETRHQFILEAPGARRIGTSIALLG